MFLKSLPTYFIYLSVITKSSKSCVYFILNGTFQTRLATFQVLNSRTWLGATVLDSAASGHMTIMEAVSDGCYGGDHCNALLWKGTLHNGLGSACTVRAPTSVRQTCVPIPALLLSGHQDHVNSTS